MSHLDLLAAYRTMATIRGFETRAAELRATGEIVCSLHLCNGQEAIAVGARAAIEQGDTVLATYRGHHWAIACGVPLDALFAEFLGREGGVNGGRGGAGLFVAPEVGFLGENGIVGGGAPIAVGVALAARYDGSGRVSLAAFGDGALNQGAVHEAMNFAAVYNLPVVFVCENNGYAEYTSTPAMFRIARLADRARAYGFPGVQVDGEDPEAVFAAVAKAVERARAGEGPTLVEALAHRLEGHHTNDSEHYRPREEKSDWQKYDAIARLRSRLGEQVESVAATVAQAVEDALDQARASPPADPVTLLEHVYG